MRFHVLFGSALMMGLLAAAACADDKITFKIHLSKGTEYKTASRVSVESRMRSAGAAATPGGPAASVDPSATVGMGSSTTAQWETACKIEQADADGQTLRLAPSPIRIKQVPDMGYSGRNPADVIDPSLRLKVDVQGNASVLGAEAPPAQNADAAQGGRTMTPKQQAEQLKKHFALATFWMPKQAVGIGDEWDVVMRLPMEDVLSLSAPVAGKCKLASRADGVARMDISGGANGSVTVDEKTGWMLTCDVTFRPSAEAVGGPMQVTGRFIQKTVK